MFSSCQHNNIEDFKFYLLWGYKTRRPLDLLKKDDVILAVNKAYIDMQPRTIDGLGLKLASGKNAVQNNSAYWTIVTDKEQGIKAIKGMVASEVVSIIKKCHNNKGYTQTDFDNDHDKLCKSFIDQFITLISKINTEIKKYNSSASSVNQIKNDNIDPKKITYGKAQKIVNMTFKYLSLFGNADQFDNVFSLCHIAIDSYIIDEIKSLVDNCGISKTLGQPNTLKKAWSNYDEQNYRIMLDLERAIIKSQSYTAGKVLFFEEFEWWKKHFDKIRDK